MRDILFRGKRIDNGELVYGYFYIDKCGMAFIIDKKINYSYKVDLITVTQFTGLHDKDGKKIFEGDIVRFYSGNASRIGEVKFGEIMVPSTTDQFESCEYVGYYIFASEYDGVEVIGNIYDNPELLEENNGQ